MEWRMLDRRGRFLVAVGAALAALPALAMVQRVRSGSHLQHTDYWPMALTLFEPDGGLDVGGLFEFRNEHPVVTAKALYWLNFQLTGGSNVMLGYAVVAIVVVQLGLLAGMARTSALARWQQVALVVAGSALLFAPYGAWSFVKAMSGTAWLTANLFAIAAIRLRVRRGRYWALPLGALATISYGTGLVVWPALLLTGWLLDRRLRPQWPTILAGAASAAWYLVNYLDTASSENSRSGGWTVVHNGCLIIGSIIAPTDDTVATWLGAAVLVGMATCVVVAVRRHGTAAAPWLGLGTMGAGSALLIGFGRIERVPGALVESRYASPAALVWIALLALVLLSLPRRPVAIVPLVVVALAATLTGGEIVDELRETKPRQDLLAIAMHLDLASGASRWTVFETFPPVTDLLRSIGHHPFDHRWDADCGMLGQQLAGDRIGATASVSAGSVTTAEDAPKIAGGVEFVGWVPSQRPVACVVVLDEANRTVGAGVVGYGNAGDGRWAFRALAPSGASSYSVAVRHEGAERLVRLPIMLDEADT